MVVNFGFDGIRQDAFSFEGGQLHERLVSITAPRPVADATGEVEAALGCFEGAARIEPGFVPAGAM
ncbi:hypothetical protein WME90_10445 [Sorangium sp. So ce375]|uniref:hypothetical protein n=1 Tax=Sorangium sp. So ce375 TaxID=3133306 RepID=UPI003F5C7A32